MKEYAIWGEKKDEAEESLLCEMIPTYEKAKKICEILTGKYSCSSVRIQTIDFSIAPDFSGVIGRK